MTTRKTLLSCAGLACFLAATPQSASARDFVGYASTDPLLYLYAACVFEKNDGTAEEQLERCATVKTSASETADTMIERFHTRGRADVRREFDRGLAEIEKDAEQLRKKSKPVPAAIATYLKCLGQNVMVTPDYQSGDAVSYIGVEEPCAEISFAGVKEIVSEREWDTIDALYRRFQRFGRLTYPTDLRAARNRRQSAFRLPPATTYDRSFLNLSLMRKAKDQSSDD